MERVTKWQVPEGGGAPHLCQPNIPHPLHGCLEPDAEVMTPAGWVSIKDAQKDMNILCWDNGEVFWDRVQGTVKEYYDTAIKVKYRKTHNFDMVYSPNHRIVAEYKERYHGAHKEKLDKPIWRSFVRTAYDFRPGPSTYFPTAARMRGEGGLTDRERVYIAIQADGHHKRMTAKNEYYYVVRVSKVRKQQRLDELLPKSGLHYRKNEYDTKDGKHVYSYHIMSPVECKNLYSCFSLKRMSYNKAREMIQEFCKWDGYEGSSIFGTARQYYCSTNEKNIGFVQAVAMMGGYTTTTHKREEVPEKGWSALWHVWFRDTTRRSTAKVVKEEIPYNDYMYCVTVPSSFFVVRYHGVVMVTGNCAPRAIMGATEWNKARTACYEACNRHCEICGAECPPGKMDAHELYNFDYVEKTATFVRLIGLCKQCVDEDTEVLTESGWKRIPEVTCEDKVACWDKTGAIDFLHPTDTIVSHPDKAVKIKRGEKELYFSPEHRLPLKVASKQSPSYGQIKVVQAQDYRASHYYNWLATGMSRGEEHLTVIERLYIAIEADGHLSYDKENPHGNPRQRERSNRYGAANYRYTYTIRLGKARKKERFQNLLDESEVKYRRSKDQAGEACWTVWLNVEAKHFTECFKMAMSATKAQEFLEELVFWDGTYSKRSTAWYTNKLEEADFVQGVAAQCGVVANISVVNRLGNLRKGQWKTPYERLSYQVTLKSNYIEYCAKEMPSELIPWDEPMYCISVPTTFFVARRDGLVFITGNCHGGVIHSGRAITMYKNCVPLWTKEVMLQAAEHGFQLVYEWNKLHPDEEPLKMFSTILDWLKEPTLTEDLQKLIDRYEIEFYDVPDTESAHNWGKWRLIYNDKEYWSPYHDKTEWAAAMAKKQGRELENSKDLFDPAMMSELAKIAGQEGIF